MSYPIHLKSPSVRDLTREVVALARAGDHRARPVTVLGRPGVIHDRMGIVTPHLKEDGELDGADLAAQILAIAFETFSADGRYTGGIFISGGVGHCVPEPPGDDHRER